jgi:flagellar biosynthesis/type III secretory pathway protein FliH
MEYYELPPLVVYDIHQFAKYNNLDQEKFERFILEIATSIAEVTHQSTYDESYQEGYDKGYEEGKETVWAEYSDDLNDETEYMKVDKAERLEEVAHDEGRNEGYREGYTLGYEDGKNGLFTEDAIKYALI